MAIIVVFLLGVANFALHRAALANRGAIIDQLPPILQRLYGRASLAVEFIVLLGAMVLVTHGEPSWAWAYLGYSILNGSAAWFIANTKV